MQMFATVEMDNLDTLLAMTSAYERTFNAADKAHARNRVGTVCPPYDFSREP